MVADGGRGAALGVPVYGPGAPFATLLDEDTGSGVPLPAAFQFLRSRYLRA